MSDSAESYGAVVPSRWDASVFVPAPRSEVFAYLADPRNRPEWQGTLARVEMIDDGDPRVGMRWVDHLRGGPSLTLQIIGLEPDEMWAEVGRVGPLTAFITLLFEDAEQRGVTGTCVRVVVRIRSAVRPLGWAGTAVLGLLVRTDLPRIVRAMGRRDGRR